MEKRSKTKGFWLDTLLLSGSPFARTFSKSRTASLRRMYQSCQMPRHRDLLADHPKWFCTARTAVVFTVPQKIRDAAQIFTPGKPS
jgi:hypothetical protein